MTLRGLCQIHGRCRYVCGVMMAAGSVLSERTSRFVLGLVHFERMCQLIVLLIGAYCALAGRNLPIGPDGLAYLDVARARILAPGIRTEFAMVRAVNVLVFFAALYTFSVYWRALADWCRRTNVHATSIPDAAPYTWIALGYLLFIVNFAWFVDVVSPDILVAAIVFAIAALLFKLNDYLPHGLVAYGLLAVGYYAKAILCYFAVPGREGDSGLSLRKSSEVPYCDFSFFGVGVSLRDRVVTVNRSLHSRR